MWELDQKEGWVTKIDAFKLWYWRRLLRVLWTSRRSKSQFWWKSTLNIHQKDCYWSWSSNTLATWCKKLTHWKRPWYWERWRIGGKKDGRRWDAWMASSSHWIRVWASSGRWWRTGKPGVLQSWNHKLSYMTYPLKRTDLIFINMCLGAYLFMYSFFF